MTAARQAHLDEFYRLLAGLARHERGPRRLACRHPSPGWAEAEDQLERAVSQHIRAMPFLWLAVPTRPDGSSDRGLIERNSIALLSCATGSPDTPSPGWLGHHATSSNIRRSGLWNSNHVEETCQPGFLELLASLTENTPATTAPRK